MGYENKKSGFVRVKATFLKVDNTEVSIKIKNGNPV
jgi:hypothetical protein